MEPIFANVDLIVMLTFLKHEVYDQPIHFYLLTNDIPFMTIVHHL